MEAVFLPEVVRIFSGGFLSTSCAFRQEPAGNHRKKSENFPAGILLPQNHRNYPEPAVSGPGYMSSDRSIDNEPALLFELAKACIHL